jgi:hypothetical protein
MSKKIKSSEELKSLRDRFKADMAVRCIPKNTQEKSGVRECCDRAASKSAEKKH